MNDLNEVIRAHAMLVSVHIKHWSGQVKDNAAAQAAAVDSGAEGAGAYKAVKNLLFKHDARLKAVLRSGNDLRTLHNESTMSWDGGRSQFRMLPVVQFGPYTTAVAKAKSHYDVCLKEFMDNYLSDAKLARGALNLPDDADTHRLYPTEDSLVARFGVTLEFEPIAEGQTFKNLPDGVHEALAAKFESRVTRRYKESLALAYQGLLAGLVHLREVVGAPIADDKAQKWKNACVFNVAAQAETLSTFNLSGSTEHEEFCGRVVKQLGGFTEKTLTALRQPKNPDMRQELIDDVAGLEIELETLMED